MSYSRKCIMLVNEEFEAKRQKNEATRQARLSEIYSKIPDIEAIDNELSKTGMQIMSCALKGRDGLEKRLNTLRENNLALQKKREELLVNNGFTSDYTDLKYDCPLCQDYGSYNGKACQCYKSRLIEEQFKLSGISNLVKTQSFDTFSLDVYKNRDEMEKMLEYAKDYVKNFESNKRNILFVGPTGLGKTHLSTAIAKALIEKGYSVIYETAQNIFFDFENDRFRDRFGDSEAQGDKYLECDLLIIDDLGAESVSSFSVACLYNILNTRLNKNLPIIASTNFTSSEIMKNYHDRITSRLFGEFFIKKFSGEDIRRQKK